MILEIKNLVKRYDDLLAVDNVELRINEGEIFGLLGPNGAGKTTTISSIIGLVQIDSGEINIFGKNMNKNEKELKSQIGVVPQDLAIYEDLTAYENVSYFASLYGLKGSVLKEKTKKALEFTGLWDRRKDLAKKFSGGMKRRLNIACAIAHEPKLIIMDEPTVGIDPQSRNHILESVKELNRKGTTIIYTSHYMEEVEDLCQRIAIMDHGRVIAEGTADELQALVSIEDRIEIDLKNPTFNLVDELKKIYGINDCILENNHISIVSDKNSGCLNLILEKIAATNTEITNLNVDRPNLETVFLTLTGRSLRDQVVEK